MIRNSLKIFFVLTTISCSCFIISCKNQSEENTTESEQPSQKVETPAFNADSAYAYVEKQVSFGPRVPGTAAQKTAAAWMKQKLEDFCDTVYVQDVQVKAGDGKMLPCINLIGTINPHAKTRILLLAHWDSRPR